MITKSGLDTENFKSNGVGTFKKGLENTYTADVPTDLYVLTNKRGTEACFTNLGARLVSLMINGRDIVLGFDNIEQYADFNNHNNVFGAIIGRYANRIGGAKFKLDGKTYNLPVNNGDNCLHGGPYNWAYQTWTKIAQTKDHIKFNLVSPDGDSGFPGEINTTVTYTLNDDDELFVEYEATTNQPTVINLTNHTYFNLEGNPAHDILNDTLQINSKFLTVLGDQCVPNGEIASIRDGSPLDFYKPKKIGKDIAANHSQIKAGNGFDHNFIILDQSDDVVYAKVYNIPLIFAAQLHNDISNITMRVYSTEYGLQFYDSVDLDGSFIGKNGIAYGPHCAACLESQNFANSPNIAHFPSSILLPSQRYVAATCYQFTY